MVRNDHQGQEPDGPMAIALGVRPHFNRPVLPFPGRLWRLKRGQKRRRLDRHQCGAGAFTLQL